MPTRIRVVDRVADILGCFTSDGPELGVSEISAKLDLDKATVCRILLTLKSRGYVRADTQTQKYSIGPQILHLAEIAIGNQSLRAQARPYCTWLRDQTRETAALSVRDGFVRLCIEQVESKQEIKRSTEASAPLPLHSGAAGKILLAYMPPAELERYLAEVELERFTESTITDRNILLANLNRVCEQGYAVSLGERIVGSVTIAVPVFDHGSRVVAALSVALPLMRYRPEALPAYVETLQTASRGLSADLGYLPPSKPS